jgi:hypothetical protein
VLAAPKGHNPPRPIDATSEYLASEDAIGIWIDEAAQPTRTVRHIRHAVRELEGLGRTCQQRVGGRKLRQALLDHDSRQNAGTPARTAQRIAVKTVWWW